MATEEEFKAAAERTKTFTKRPDNAELLALYALFKQASDGDVSGARPGMFDLKGRAKYDAWAAQKGKSKDASRDEYVALVAKLAARYTG